MRVGVTRRGVVAALISLLTRPVRASTKPVVSVADYGAVPGADDATAGVNAAVAHLPKRGGVTLLFPPGVYNFAIGTDVAIKVEAMEELTVDGRGATLNLQGKTFPAAFSDCDGLFVRGLTIDWPRPPFSQGEIVSISPGGWAIDIRIDDEFPVDGSEKVEAITTHERGTLRMTMRGVDVYRVVEAVSLVEHQRLRLILKRPLPLHLGDIVVVRHQVYGTEAFRVFGCRGVRIDDVTVYAAPGMALLAVSSTDITIRRFRIEPRPGTIRLMSTCADGLHFAWCRGKIDIRDCYLAGLGDDCINVHGRNLVIAERIDARTIVVHRPGHEPLGDADLAVPGDRVEFLDRLSLASLGEREIVEGIGKRLRFSEDLPDSLAPGDFLCDTSEVATVTIADCQFPGNRARAILAHRNTVIERCSFANQFYEAILILFDTEFADGPTIGDVTIARNRFHGTGRAEIPRGAIRIRSLVKSSGTEEPISSVLGRGIKIVDNVIVDSGGSAIEVGEARDVQITGNRIERRTGPAIVLQNVRKVRIDDNLCRPPAALVMHETPAGEVTIRGNAGLVT
jgi:hypothetical protein